MLRQALVEAGLGLAAVGAGAVIAVALQGALRRQDRFLSRHEAAAELVLLGDFLLLVLGVGLLIHAWT